MLAAAAILCSCIVLRCFSSAATEFSKVGATAAFSAFLALLVSAAGEARAEVDCCEAGEGGGGEVEGGSVLIFGAVVLDFAWLLSEVDGEEVPYL